MKKKGSISEIGMSLIELMVVLVITTILVTVAIAQFDNAKKDFQTQNVAKELQAYLVRARYDSVKRRPSIESEMASVVIDSETSFTVNIDLSQDGVLNASDSKTFDFTGNNDVSILGDGLVLPIRIHFDRHGHVNAFDSLGNLVTPRFVVCSNCAGQDGSSAVGYRIALSASGTVSMGPTSEVVTTFSPPPVTSIPDGDNINDLLKVDVSTGNSPNPSPSPSSSPSQSPSPSPSSSPPLGTPTPTPTPAPQPTATPPPPVACARNERPSHTGCVCQSPKRVRGNGQCK